MRSAFLVITLVNILEIQGVMEVALSLHKEMIHRKPPAIVELGILELHA
jgi:hypothetical protein